MIVGGAEAWMVAEELAAAGIPVLMDPLRNLPASFDALASTLDSRATSARQAGVTVAYTTQTADGYFNARLMPQHAGNAVANGVAWDAASARSPSPRLRYTGLVSDMARWPPAMPAMWWSGTVIRWR